MVTSSPFPTCSSPSQLVSMDAGLKSSKRDGHRFNVNQKDKKLRSRRSDETGGENCSCSVDEDVFITSLSSETKVKPGRREIFGLVRSLYWLGGYSKPY